MKRLWLRAKTMVFLSGENEAHCGRRGSPYDATSGTFDRLQSILRTLGEHAPRDAYMQRLAEVAEKSGEVGKLGLLRIAHELGAQITAQLREDAVHVRADWSFATGVSAPTPAR